MTISILVLKEVQSAYELSQKLKDSSTQIIKFELVEPSKEKKDIFTNKSEDAKDNAGEESIKLFKLKNINETRLLNPELSRKERQKTMSLWLMPFGLIAGITFSGMTNLNTFSISFKSFYNISNV